MKRRFSLLLCLMLLTASLPVSVNAKNKVLYDAIITRIFGSSYTNVYVKPDKDSKVLTKYNPGHPIQIVEVLPNYVGILYGDGVGYVLRHRIENPVSVDVANIPRFGTAVNRYYSTMTANTPVMSAPDSNSETLITMYPGAMLGFLDIKDGWARTIFKREYGYVDTRLLGNLIPVALNPETAPSGAPIAVYNSFYNIAEDENNLNRIFNLTFGSERMSKTLAPGQSLDFNGEVGPFSLGNGYKMAGALVDGKWDLAPGGGSCQISSTLYNVVLQLTGLTVLVRSPHGPHGVSYIPHGVDASSGKLNFIFRNDYPFPVTISAHVQDGSLFVAIYKGSGF